MNVLLLIFVSLSFFSILILYFLLGYMYLYQSHIFKNKIQKKFLQHFTPSTAVFIPCKNNALNFSDHIKAFTKIKSPHYQFYFTVESKIDPAYDIIKKIIQKHKNLHLIVAGLSVKCGQKNHNLIRAIESSGEKDDVYVFIDSDIPVSLEYLDSLIIPLSDEKITVSTGFRWLHLNKNTFGERLHSLMNALLRCFIHFKPFKGIWGGSMAIRRIDFEELGVKKYWSETVVDDSTLQKLIIKNKKKVVLVPSCLSETTHTMFKLSSAVFWFKRQCLFIKFYYKLFWIYGALTFFFISLNLLLFPLSILLLLLHCNEFTFYFFIYSMIYHLLVMIWGLAIKNKENDSHHSLTWFLSIPLNIVIGTYSFMLTLFSCKMKWCGITYKIKFNGTIKEIIR